MSARKMRLVVDLIRGKGIEEALDILRFTKKEAAVWLEKLLIAAIANWEVKTGGMENADDYDLYVKTVFADEGAVLKRFRPAPHGRAHRIRKRTTHVTLIVENRVRYDRAEPVEDVTEVEEVESESLADE
jgi:large subunit ribosomal protein L22